MPDAPDLSGPDIDDVDEDAPTFKRRIAIAVVLVTFFGAVIAYFHAASPTARRECSWRR